MDQSSSKQLDSTQSNSNQTTNSRGKTGNLTSKQIQATQATKNQAKKPPTTKQLIEAQKRIEEAEKKREKENLKAQRENNKQLERERKKRVENARDTYPLDGTLMPINKENGMGTGCP